MWFKIIYRLKKIQTCSSIKKKKTYSYFIEILQAKGHVDYLNGGYPLNLKNVYKHSYLYNINKQYAVGKL